MRDAFFAELERMMAEDERVTLLYGDVGYSYVEPLHEKYGGRVINCGIREQAMVGAAAGMALEGKLPFVYTMATFLTRKAFEQIAVDICEPNLPVRLVGADSGLGFSHIASEDIRLMLLLPNMTANEPTCDRSLKMLMHNEAPTYIRLSRTAHL